MFHCSVACAANNISIRQELFFLNFTVTAFLQDFEVLLKFGNEVVQIVLAEIERPDLEKDTTDKTEMCH